MYFKPVKVCRDDGRRVTSKAVGGTNAAPAGQIDPPGVTVCPEEKQGLGSKMIPGETIQCPCCGEKSVVKSRTKMNGWTKVGTVLVCALCGAELGAPEERTAAAAVRRKSDSLASLLGEGAEFTPGADLTPDENYGRFCRNCVHFLAHPFKTLCSKYNRPADPMGDCPEFEKRKEQA